MLLLVIVSVQFGFSQIDADIELLSVSPAAGPYSYGQKITYNFRIENKSSALYDIDKVVLRNYLPAGLEYQQADNSLTWSDLGGGIYEASDNSLIPSSGGTKDYSIVLTIKSNNGGYDAWKNKIELYEFYNGVTKLSELDPDNQLNGTDTDWVEYRFDIFDLALKSVTGDVYPQYNTNVNFDITVYNQGSIDAYNVVVANYTLSGYTFDPGLNPSWSFDALTGNWKYTFAGPIGPGNNEVVTIVLKLNAVQSQSEWANYAEIVSAEDDGGVSMTDVDGVFDEDFTNDAGGKPGSDADNAIEGDGTDVIGGTNPLKDEDNHDPGYAKIYDLALVKTTDVGTFVGYGDLFTFHFTVYNQGTVSAKNIKITDYLPAGYSYNAADNVGLGWSVVGGDLENTIALQIEPGNSITIDLNLTIIDVVSDHTDYVNYAEISAAEDEGGSAFALNDDSDSEMNSNTVSEREVLPGSSIDDDMWRDGLDGYEDDFDPGIANFLDLAVKKEVISPGPYHAGDDIMFSVMVYNQGGVTVRDIELIDYIPDGYEFSTSSFPVWHHDDINNLATTTIPDVLHTGDSIELLIYLKILPNVDKFNSYNNIVEINSVKDFDFNLLYVDIDSNMDTDKTNDAGGMYWSDSDNSVLGNGTGAPNDTDDLTDEDDYDIALPEVYDLAFRNTLVTAGPYQYGQDLTFRFEVFNQGNMPVKDIKIADYIPNGFSIVSAPGWVVTGSTMTYLLPSTLNPGSSVYVEAVLKVEMTNGGEKDWIQYGEITNMKGLDDSDKSGWDLDSDLGSNSAEEFLVELGDLNDDNIWTSGPYFGEDQDDHDPAGIELFDLAVRNVINSLYFPFEYGDNIPFKVTVFNQGSDIANKVKVTEKIPCGFDFILANNPGWVEDALNNTVEYEFGSTIDPGATDYVILNLKVKPCLENGDSWVTLAEINYAEDMDGNDMSNLDFDSTYDLDFTNDAGGTPDSSEDNQIDGDGKHGPGNGHVQEEDDADPARIHTFDLALKKDLVNTNPKYGDLLVFNITIYNQGNDDAKNIDIVDYEPVGYEFDSGINPGWGGNVFTGLTYTYSGTLLSKDSVVVQLKLRMVGTDGGVNHWINYAEIVDADNATNSSFIYIDPDSTPDSDSADERAVKPGDSDDGNIASNDKGGEEDDHDPAGVWVFDLALKKDIITPGPYMHGDTVEFEVTVYNQGNKQVREVQVVDFTPEGLKYSSTNFPLWHSDSYTGNSHSTITNAMNPGDSVVLKLYSIVQLVDEKCKDAYTNHAEIFEFRDEDFYIVADDFDSTPDYIEDNDIGGTPNSPEDNHVDDDGTDYNNDGITDEDDSDPAQLEIIDVAVKAELITAAPYFYGQTQQFRIRVYNQGNDTIRDTEIQAYIPEGYELDFASNPGWNSADSTFKILDQIANCDSFDIFVNLKMVMTSGGEKDWITYFEAIHVLNNEFLDRTDWDMDSELGSDTSLERDVELGDDDDNDIWVRGVGFGEDQDDHDPAGLEIFDLALTKSYNDLYPHYYGDTIHFEIKLYNQGSIITANQEVTDYIPSGYRFESSINPDWSFDSVTGMAVTTISAAINPGDTLSKYLNLILVDSYESGDDWQNGAEISKFEDNFGFDQSGNDFDSTNDQIKDNDPGLDNDDFVGGDGKNGPTHGYTQVEDDADLSTPQVFDLALKKTLVTVGPYEYGDDITFEIEVFNQGNQIAQDIRLNDYIALGYSFNPALNPSWNYSAGLASHDLPNALLPDDSITVSIILTVERTDGGYVNWINYAEVESANNPDGLHNIDADSNPNSDSNHERDVKPGDDDDDNIFGQYISENEDEDDHDPAGIDIFDLALRKTIATTGTTFDYGQVIDFKIELFNQGNIDAKNIKLEEEAIPCGFEFNVAANPDWNYNSTSRNATFTYANAILPGEIVELHVFMTVWDCHEPDWWNSWKNKVEITYAEDEDGLDRSDDDIDSDYDNNPNNDNIIDDAIQADTNLDDDDSDIAIASIVDLALKIIADDRGPFAPGDIAPFTITVYNQGNESLKDIKIYDYISPGFSFISGATNPGWSLLNATTAQYTFSNTLAPKDSFELSIKLMVQLGTQISDWTHYAEIARAVDKTNLVLTDDADAEYASDTPYEREVQVGDLWDNEVLGIGFNRDVDEDMDDHDPASVDVVGKVGDFVWEDMDGDGIQDSGEPGIGNVIVELHNCDPASGIDVQYDTTDVNGEYLFDMVIPGMYFVKFILPGDYQFTLDNVGSNDLVDSDVDGTNGVGTTECFEVEANEEQLDIDAGAYLCAEVGDLVWLDYIKNNVYDSNETGVNGLKVALFRLTDGEWVLWDIEFTGIDPNSVCGDGYYSFCTNPGTYYIRFVTPPSGIVPVQPHIGGDNTKDSDITRAHGIGTTNTFTLVSGESGNMTIDAGYYEQAKITNSLVWHDSNANGLQDAGEAPMPNVLVEIYDSYGVKYSDATTDSDGHYEIDYLQSEDYFLKFNLPSTGQTYVFTPANQGDDTKDSDVDNSFGLGTTALIPLQSSQNKENVDAGLTEGTLPLNFVQMGAEWNENKVNVSWAVSDNLDVEKFIIQRAFEGDYQFKDIAEIIIEDKEKSFYSYDDVDKFKNGVYYYRIVAVDFDGSIMYSNKDAVFVNLFSKESLVDIYPNPVVNEASVRFGVTSDSEVTIDVLDITGKMALENVVKDNFIIGNYEVKVNVSNLKAATYYVRLKTNNVVTFKKMIVVGK